jgi:hypothetical protein
MIHALAGGIFPEDEDLASAWCDQGCETEAPTVSEAISLLTCVSSSTTNEEAPASGRTPSRGTTENPEQEPINMVITAATTDIRTLRRNANEFSTSVRRNLRAAMRRQHIGPLAMARLSGMPAWRVLSVYLGREISVSALLRMQAALGLSVTDLFATTKGN